MSSFIPSTGMKTLATGNHRFHHRYGKLLLSLAILLVLIIRYHWLSFPLERDEGEYAYMGKLILDGHPPYTLAYNMKLPGVYYMYALFMLVFGATATGIHIGLTLLTVGSMLLLWAIAGKFISRTGAAIAATTYGIMATSVHVLGQAAHATHFVVFFALAGLWVLTRKEISLSRIFLAGILLGLAILCKQSGVFYLLSGGVFLLASEHHQPSINKKVVRCMLLFLGSLLPYATTALYLKRFGDFDKFWFWTVEFLSKYGNTVSVQDAPGMFISAFKTITANFSTGGYILLWITALAGFIALLASKQPRQEKLALSAFSLCSFLTVVPGFYFRQHYFITLFPAVAFLTALFFEWLSTTILSKQSKIAPAVAGILLFVCVALSGIVANAHYLFTSNAQETCKELYKLNPFAESEEIGQYLNEHSLSTDKIAILGSEPQILFYADRYSATGHIYAYNLVEDQPYAAAMQHEVSNNIESAEPKFILYVNIDNSWLIRPGSSNYIFTWANDYVSRNYSLKAVVNVLPNTISPVISGQSLTHFQPQSREVIEMYERK